MTYMYEHIATRIANVFGCKVTITPYEGIFDITLLFENDVKTLKIKKPDYISHWETADFQEYIMSELKKSYPEYYL